VIIDMSGHTQRVGAGTRTSQTLANNQAREINARLKVNVKVKALAPKGGVGKRTTPKPKSNLERNQAIARVNRCLVDGSKIYYKISDITNATTDKSAGMESKFLIDTLNAIRGQCFTMHQQCKGVYPVVIGKDEGSFRPIGLVYLPSCSCCLGTLPAETVAKPPCGGRCAAIWLQFEPRGRRKFTTRGRPRWTDVCLHYWNMPSHCLASCIIDSIQCHAMMNPELDWSAEVVKPPVQVS
jgi:hypothetical protein